MITTLNEFVNEAMDKFDFTTKGEISIKDGPTEISVRGKTKKYLEIIHKNTLEKFYIIDAEKVIKDLKDNSISIVNIEYTYTDSKSIKIIINAKYDRKKGYMNWGVLTGWHISEKEIIEFSKLLEKLI